MAKQVLLIPHNHFDPTWRRCFDRPAHYRGVTVRSYAEVEERIIESWLSLVSRGYTFSEGQTAVWRKYLQRNPDRLSQLQRLAHAGQLAVMRAGETVQDSNLSSAEGLVRNFLIAEPFYRQFVGKDHPGLQLAWLEDGFGNSANYPQILRGVGCTVACAVSYKPVPGEVWIGLDGAAIACYDSTPGVGTLGVEKHPPCPACKGAGCTVCGNSGMQWIDCYELHYVRKILNEARQKEEPIFMAAVNAEELPADPAIADLVEELNADGGPPIRFATPLDRYEAFAEKLKDAVAKATPAGKLPEPTPELNPVFAGCMVSRIRCKQRTRGVAYQLLAAEAKLANAAWQNATPAAMPDDLRQAWQRVCFTQFHDAITGTHIDSAYTELMDMLDEAERLAAPYLPVTAPPAAPVFSPASGEKTTVSLGKFTVVFDRAGIVSISQSGKDPCGSLPHNRIHRDLRIGELCIDADFGDAWGTRMEPFSFSGVDFSRVLLGDYHTHVEMAIANDAAAAKHPSIVKHPPSAKHSSTANPTATAIRWHGIYTGGDPKINHLAWSTTVQLSPDGRRLDFHTDVDWDTSSRRLKAMFPVASQETTAQWEIPFGFIDREYDPAKANYSQWQGNSLEYAAHNWVRKTVDAASGVAILNRGLPCHRWMPGHFELSLLRSPEWQFCVVENSHYEFWDIAGQRDAGRHAFDYSLWPYTDGVTTTDLIRAGYAYNLPAPIDPPFAIEGNVLVTAWKPAEDGKGWILRLQETAGADGEAKLKLDRECAVGIVNLLEDPTNAKRPPARIHTWALHRHQILTLKIEA